MGVSYDCDLKTGFSSLNFLLGNSFLSLQPIENSDICLLQFWELMVSIASLLLIFLATMSLVSRFVTLLLLLQLHAKLQTHPSRSDSSQEHLSATEM